MVRGVVFDSSTTLTAVYSASTSSLPPSKVISKRREKFGDSVPTPTISPVSTRRSSRGRGGGRGFSHGGFAGRGRGRGRGGRGRGAPPIHHHKTWVNSNQADVKRTNSRQSSASKESLDQDLESYWKPNQQSQDAPNQ
uniref:Chromatin target of PRMT1 protein C-terminal domain-containing protein n=1 Tax=Spongospora subterranea TaxID=70186 RepID=A0A0H5R631_9EUKA|eukprot:CRZ09615.1 hypothetical protein [Spongospora subterranea]